MNHTMLALFGAAIGLYALQAAGAYYQMRRTYRNVKRAAGFCLPRCRASTIKFLFPCPRA